MLSNAQQKYVLSLHQKKFRKLHNAFIVEGRKNVAELTMSDYQVLKLFITDSCELPVGFAKETELIVINEKELDKISTLQKSDGVLAVVQRKSNEIPKITSDELVLLLDNVNDPGNLGTIIRTADWYGIKHIVCSETTVEFYNPKVIMASMGSFARVNLYYTDLSEYLKTHPVTEIYGAFLEGESVHELRAFNGGLLIMGSESHGISDQLSAFVTKKITIPRFGGAESLNVAVSTAILLDNLIKFK